jgi:hypothetical protein
MNIRTRLKKLEHTMTEQEAIEVWDDACICFPPGEPPEFCWNAEAVAAAAVLCPLHGVRFHAIRVRPFIYRAKWLRRSEDNASVDYATANYPNHSLQYSKAWRASFPSGLWPAEERCHFQPDRITLILRDGTEIPSGGSADEWQPEKLEAGP